MSRPRILLSLDSTWWNRLGMSRLTYERMLRRAGCRARPIRYRDVPAGDGIDRESVAPLFEGISGLLLSGGGDVSNELYGVDDRYHRDVSVERDQFETALLETALERGMPVLGVCRGAQLMNVLQGGINRSLRAVPGLAAYHRLRRHPVRLEEGSRLSNMVPEAEGKLHVSSYHAHAVDTCGDSLEPVAFAPDGVIEAIECKDPGCWQVGVQWHPEWMPRNRYQRRLLAAFGAAARAFETARA